MSNKSYISYPLQFKFAVNVLLKTGYDIHDIIPEVSEDKTYPFEVG